jgi:hypothetical protein
MSRSPSVAGGWDWSLVSPVWGSAQDMSRGSELEGNALRTRFMLS